MKRVVVLGGGMVGGVLAADLADRYSVTVVDRDESRLTYLSEAFPLEIHRHDLKEGLPEIIKDAHLVVSAVPGSIGYKTLELLIEAGKNAVDISFMPEDVLLLHPKAVEAGVSIVADCGVAPGMCNILLGYHVHRETVNGYRCLVGGLPVKRQWPWQYKAPFSPSDVLEEYTRPVRLRIEGKDIVKPALSDSEYVDIEPVGTLEAFNTDGLRTLLKTTSVPNMIEKTLRYPGHIDHVEFLKGSGFFSRTPLQFGSVAISPFELTSRVLIESWKGIPDEKEFTIMQVDVTTEDRGKSILNRWNMIDYNDPETGFSSMARTTGFTCNAVVELIMDDLIPGPGIIPPEHLGREETLMRRILKYLEERNIIYHFTLDPLLSDTERNL